MAVAGCANSSSGSGGGSGSGGALGGDLKNLPAQSKIDVPADAVKPAGDGKAKCSPNTTIAYVGAMTGDNAQLGINIYNGVQLAINEHNKANPGCQVKFIKSDTEGDATKATGPVAAITKNQNVVGVIGLPFSSESKATGAAFESAGLVHITPSATNPTLTANGWTTFFRGLGNDNVQGPAVAKLAKKLGAKKVFVIGDDSDYGSGLFKTAKEGLDKAGMTAGEDHTVGKQTDFSSTAQKVIDSKADAVFYAGYYNEGSPLDQQLVQKGFKGVFFGPDGVKDDQFIKLAGDSSKNAYFTCPCIPGDLIPSFASAYNSVSGGKAAGTYSVEGYDATTILLTGIDKGDTTRAKLKDFVKNYDASGLSKKYKWDSKGELSDLVVYGYKVENGKIVSVGKID
ncbi:branched-chain amino acid ABC transporter substrate-binding protein [Flexivirga sp. ID2601S]|uniref:Branched-chain amino acid ABC transporter substrate-binding protein n=2 Tax=Flexivirga aerilata TaxID=1656889 RepID=A0A849AN41_9MICO|nr:branched-chain amino acid ABC transporter substrate-binding protein [Flexivirga aerilata]NNG41207.1 branched-chain amino acid ABC transporter substrate-binding protein [Flexivirga aerilata]